MNRKQAKEMLPIIQAFAEGKGVETKTGSGWISIENMSFAGNPDSYRIKPESKYRPFYDNAEECWQEMMKHQPFGWVKMKGTESKYYMLKCIGSRVVIGLDETPFSYKKVFEDYVFADGAPFGVKVVEK